MIGREIDTMLNHGELGARGECPGGSSAHDASRGGKPVRGVGKTSVRNSVRKHCPGAVCELVNVRDERGTLVGCEGVVRDKATGRTLGVRVDQGRATVWDDESAMLCWASDVGQSVAWLMSDPIGEFEALND